MAGRLWRNAIGRPWRFGRWNVAKSLKTRGRGRRFGVPLNRAVRAPLTIRFGSFLVKEKKERQGRNPRTGETITIPAKRDASFKPGEELSEKLPQAHTELKPA
jgi:hypothetical protein